MRRLVDYYSKSIFSQSLYTIEVYVFTDSPFSHIKIALKISIADVMESPDNKNKLGQMPNKTLRQVTIIYYNDDSLELQHQIQIFPQKMY